MESNIEETSTGYLVTIPVADGLVKFSFAEVEQSRSREIEAVVSTWEEIPGQQVEPYVSRLNVMSRSAVTDYRRALDDSFGKGAWAHVLQRAIGMLEMSWQSRTVSMDLSEVAPAEAVAYLLKPWTVRGPAVLFGEGESGKTFLSLAILRALVTGEEFMGETWPRFGNALYVDYEADAETLALRAEMLGGRPEGLRYWPGRGIPLHEQLPGIVREVERYGIQYMVVDSAALACGGEPQNPEPALRYFNALARIGLPSLTIAHLTKDAKNDDHPFGSIFWSTSARLTWRIKAEQEDGVTHIGLFNKKSNNTASRHPPVGLRLEFSESRIWFEREDVGAEFSEMLGTRRRVRDFLLRVGKAKRREIADELELSDAAVRKALQRMSDAFVEGPSRSPEAVWCIGVNPPA